jgi:transcriptional regulator with XRE-family HTH domain
MLRDAQQPERDDQATGTPGEHLKRQLRLHGLSALDLADEFDIHPQTIYNVTSGKRQISAKLAVKLAEKFGQPVEFWLGEPLPEPVAPQPTNVHGMAAMRGATSPAGRPGNDLERFPSDLLVDHALRETVNRAGSGLAIHPFDEANISPASFDLTIGLIVTKGFSKLDKYAWGLIVKYECNDETLLEDERAEARALIREYEDDIEYFDALTLEKREAVGIVMREELKFSRDFLARAGGTTKNAIRGLNIEHGLQVDPGYSGPILITAFNMGLERIDLQAEQKILSLEIIRLGHSPADPYHEGTNSKIARIVERLSAEITALFDYEVLAQERRVRAELRQNSDVSFICDGELEEVRSTVVRRVIEGLAAPGEVDPFALPFARALGQVTIEKEEAEALIRRFPEVTAEAQVRALDAFNDGADRRTLKETIKKLDLVPGLAIAKLMGIKSPDDAA